MNKTIIHILYSGLGGHGSVVFSYLSQQYLDSYDHKLIFFGTEDLNPDYINKCNEIGLEYHFVKKTGLFFSIKLTKLVLKLKPALIINHSLTVTPLLIFSKFFGSSKVITVEHGLPSLKRQVDFIWSSLAQLISNRIVYLSEFAKSKFKMNIRFYSKRKALVISNGINTDQFSATQNENKDNNILFTHGRMVAVKDLMTLLNSALILKTGDINFKLLLAGDGEEKSKLQAYVEENDLTGEVEFLGVLPEVEITTQLKSASVYINCSLIENLSTSLLQAMACELPCIVSDIESNVNIVEDLKSGFIFKTSDSQDLANKIISLFENKQRALQIGKTARQVVCENYSMNITSQKYFDVSRQLME